MSQDLVLPSEMEEDALDKTKIEVFFFLDTSGSCIGYKNRFFKAALSLPKNFNVRLFCFDTQVRETTLISRKIYGGGGTNFGIIEAHIQKVMKEDKCAYPKAVFIITDGWGTAVNPAKAENWYWFLTTNNSRNYIPEKSNVYLLANFE